MKNKFTFLIAAALVSPLFLLTANAAKTKNKAATPAKTQVATYTYIDRHFSFTIPADWVKQGGDVNSDMVLFMAQPLKKTCSFQVNMTRMQLDFPAEASVAASLSSATKDIAIGKNISAKRRDESGMEKGKPVKFTRGWEVTEKGQKGGHQRIIYQAYDRENYYFNMMAAAETEHFEECRADLQKIIASIKFGD